MECDTVSLTARREEHRRVYNHPRMGRSCMQNHWHLVVSVAEACKMVYISNLVGCVVANTVEVHRLNPVPRISSIRKTRLLCLTTFWTFSKSTFDGGFG